MSPVAPEEVADEAGRLVARIGAAAAALDPVDEPITVELVVETVDEAGRRSDSWFLRLDEHGGRAALGPAPEPTVVVRIERDTFAALRSGALDMQRAIDGALLHVRGDLGALSRARPALRALAAALATG